MTTAAINRRMDQPIFISGTQRSGTTLMFQMLSSHSEIDLQNEIYNFYPYITGESSLSEREITTYLAQSLNVSETAIVRKQQQNAFSLLESAFAERLRLNTKQRWGVKDPHLTYALHEFIERYPKAKFVFMVRDPRAVINSYLARRFNIANCYHGALLWTKEVALQREFREAHSNNSLLVRYEDLVADKDRLLRRVCEFLELPLEDSVLNYFQNPAQTRIHDGTKNITRDVDPRILEKWKTSLSNHQIRTIEALTAAEAQKNGYDIEPNNWRCSSLKKYSFNIHQWVVTTYIWQQHKRKRLGTTPHAA